MHEDILSDLIISNTPSIHHIRASAASYPKQFWRNKYVTDCPKDWIITYQYERSTVYHTASSTYYANADSILILPKGYSYRWRLLKPGSVIAIRFDTEKRWDDILSFSVKKPDKFLAAFQRLDYLQSTQDPLRNIKIIKGTYNILQMLMEQDPSYVPSNKAKQVLPAYEYIVAHFEQSIRNDHLAQLCGLSTAHFRKLFYDVYDVSPLVYVRNLRMRKAQELLKSESASITDIALTLGYNNIYEFSKMFKKCCGISPTQFINEWRSGLL